VLRIRSQILAAHAAFDLDAHRWTATWKPALEAIERTWLPMFTADIRAVAVDEIHDVDVKPLPPLRDA
jgi:hypothetical protein